MDREARRSLALRLLFLLGIIAAAIYSLWGTYIGISTLEITATPPFNVQVFAGKEHSCDHSPCAIDLKVGTQNLIIKKDGFEDLIHELDVELFTTHSFSPKFKIKALLEEIDSFPELIKTELYLQTKQQKQALKHGNKTAAPITYFEPALKNPLIINGENYAYVQGSDKAYKVNIRSSEKTSLPYLGDIKEGKWSPDGNYFIFQNKNDSDLYLLKNNEVQILPIIANIDQIDFTSENTVLFLSNQKVQAKSHIPMPNISQEFTSLISFDPKTEKYEKLRSFERFSGPVKNFFSLGNGAKVYYQVLEKNFRIILEKF